MRHGYLVFEKYFGRAHRNANPDMASTGKAYTSIACGIMLHEFHDKIPDGLDTKVFTEKYLPEAFPLDDPRKADITLGQLLCMTAGYTAKAAALGVVMGKVVPLKPVPGQNIRDLDMSSIRCRAVDQSRRGLLLFFARAAHRFDRAAPRHGDGTAGLHQRAPGQADGLGRVGLLPASRRFRHAARQRRRAASPSTPPMRCASAIACCTRANGRTSNSCPPITSRCATSPRRTTRTAPSRLQFEHNSDGHVAGAPRDAFYKSGAGGFGIFIVPSLDLVIYKLGGNNGQYDPALTGIPQTFKPDTSRDNWKPIPRTPFNEGSMGGDDGLRRVLEMVRAAVRD